MLPCPGRAATAAPRPARAAAPTVVVISRPRLGPRAGISAALRAGTGVQTPAASAAAMIIAILPLAVLRFGGAIIVLHGALPVGYELSVDLARVRSRKIELGIRPLHTTHVDGAPAHLRLFRLLLLLSSLLGTHGGLGGAPVPRAVVLGLGPPLVTGAATIAARATIAILLDIGAAHGHDGRMIAKLSHVDLDRGGLRATIARIDVLIARSARGERCRLLGRTSEEACSAVQTLAIRRSIVDRRGLEAILGWGSSWRLGTTCGCATVAVLGGCPSRRSSSPAVAILGGRAHGSRCLYRRRSPGWRRGVWSGGAVEARLTLRGKDGCVVAAVLSTSRAVEAGLALGGHIQTVTAGARALEAGGTLSIHDAVAAASASAPTVTAPTVSATEAAIVATLFTVVQMINRPSTAPFAPVCRCHRASHGLLDLLLLHPPLVLLHEPHPSKLVHATIGTRAHEHLPAPPEHFLLAKFDVRMVLAPSVGIDIVGVDACGHAREIILLVGLLGFVVEGEDALIVVRSSRVE